MSRFAVSNVVDLTGDVCALDSTTAGAAVGDIEMRLCRRLPVCLHNDQSAKSLISCFAALRVGACEVL